MQWNLNPKVVGASVIGFALVAGAYTISNLGKPSVLEQQQAATPADEPAARVAIAVTDSDANGIEDWRDEFVTAKPIVLNQASSTYTLPDSLTGQMSLNLIQNIVDAKSYGAFGHSQEEIISDTVDVLVKKVDTGRLYDTPDITIMTDWNDQDIRNYANTVAATIMRYNNADLEGELDILSDIVKNQDTARLPELRSIADIYKHYLEDTLKIPVPAIFTKEHLDLINTYQAIHTDIEAMALVMDDPVVTLLRLKRYQDDAAGFAHALQNMYFALEPYTNLFTVEDPAVLFVVFSPDYKI